jgi:DNA invertase Pin-like site-specific DNA recombinase
MMQVRENTESTKQQYNLKERAISLGWDPIQVQVIDEDLGLSATSSEKRHGFQKLVAQVSLAQVGAIFGLEVSRLARSCSDWHRLIELCALGDTLIIDQDGIYNPNLYNDRLVLGLKGTLSEAEIHILKSRLLGGKLNAAKEGRLRFPLPVGFIYEDSQIILDPNERVRSAIQLVLDIFKREGSAYRTVKYFSVNQLLFPKRDYRSFSAEHLYWGRLTHSRVLNILHNPVYAGAYAYGKSTRQASKKALFPNTGNVICLPMEAWEVLIKRHHEGYITWETYLANIATLEANRTFIPDQSSPPREGAALLQGIAICGCCGRKLGVRYKGDNGSYLSYECNHIRRRYGTTTSCPSFYSGNCVDKAVSKVFLSALTEANLRISLEAFDKIEEQERQIDKQWQQRIEQAEYEAQLAQRRYYAVEPENRLVARSLEAEWNERLRQLEQVKQEYQTFKNEHPPKLNKEDKEQILKLADQLPVIWNSKSTSQRDKKRLIRILIQDVTLTKLKEQRQTQLTIYWKSGLATTHFVDNPLPASEKRKTPQSTIDLIAKLSENHSDHKIVDILNAKGIMSANGQPFSVSKIEYLRYSRRIKTNCKDLPSLKDTGPRADGSYSTRQLAEILDVDPRTIFNWRSKGLINGYQAKPNSPWWFKLSQEELDKLKEIVHNRAKKK